MSTFSDNIHAEKHRVPGESFRDAMIRLASTLADSHEHFTALKDILLNMRYLFGGRIQASIGTTRTTTPYNCYVSGNIADSYTEGHGSIMARAREAAITMRQGGGIGYDFSTLRPRGALIRKLGSRSSGPVSFMDIFDAVCRTTSSSGHRRGAQMGILRIDHPDIEEFIRAKQNETVLTGFNISVAVTNEFMQAVEQNLQFQLRFDGQPHHSVSARNLWNTLMRSTYDWGEPGILFIDQINEMNNLWYCETIYATNPCGEQPLPPYGACLLGSFNLVQYLVRSNEGYMFDWTQFYSDIPPIVRAMDNVIDKALYPLAEQEDESKKKRRMGIGVTGAANCIEALGHPYGTSAFNEVLALILRGLRDLAYESSAKLAKEKEPFRYYDRRYLTSPYVTNLPQNVIDLIDTCGIRNSHLLSIAPAGTISLVADNVSSGIEPVFAYKVNRTLVEFAGTKIYEVEDYGAKHLRVFGKTIDQCTVEDHLSVLITASRYVDSAVSKTCNVPSDVKWEDFKNIYLRAWSAGCKGCTTFRVGGKRDGMMEAKPTTPTTCTVDEATGQRSCE
jgi:ribonucleoside-diphosphate reductase alpha chain